MRHCVKEVLWALYIILFLSVCHAKNTASSFCVPRVSKLLAILYFQWNIALNNQGTEIYQFEVSGILLVASPHLVFFLFRAKSQHEPQPIDARKPDFFLYQLSQTKFLISSPKNNNPDDRWREAIMWACFWWPVTNGAFICSLFGGIYKAVIGIWWYFGTVKTCNKCPRTDITVSPPGSN